MPVPHMHHKLIFRVLLIALVASPVVLAQSGHPAERLQLLGTRACDECVLSGEDFSRLDLKGVSLSKATLIGTRFYKTDLTNANLSDADLTNAVMSFADLSNTNLNGANLTGANLAGAVAAHLATAITSDKTTCPDGTAGPCR